MKLDYKKLALDWVRTENPVAPDSGLYCQTRDIFSARQEKMLADLAGLKKINEGDIYVLAAVAGEIGNNSFDHNLGNWPDIPGVFFAYDIDEKLKLTVVLADRGQGVFRTLKPVKPKISSDEEALRIAFFEKISGRAPESRGNGLKFVRESVKNLNMRLEFISGNAKAELNKDAFFSVTDSDLKGCLAIITYDKNRA